MEQSLLSLFVLMLVGFGCNSESGSKASNEPMMQQGARIAFSDTVNTSDAIRAEYEKTLEAVESGAMDSTSFTYDCNGEKNGTVTYYRHEGVLRMIKWAYSEYSHHSGTDRYFVSDGELYFVERKTTDWVFTSSEETKENIMEQRFYLLDNSLERCTRKQYEIRSNTADNPDSGTLARKRVECPPAADLMAQYNLLLSRQGTTGAIDCLRKE